MDARMDRRQWAVHYDAHLVLDSSRKLWILSLAGLAGSLHTESGAALVAIPLLQAVPSQTPPHQQLQRPWHVMSLPGK